MSLDPSRIREVFIAANTLQRELQALNAVLSSAVDQTAVWRQVDLLQDAMQALRELLRDQPTRLAMEANSSAFASGLRLINDPNVARLLASLQHGRPKASELGAQLPPPANGA
ncbi:conserved hypothetical protein [Rubrivivax sp. A210]|uniref:hypothetical protein n=1 Tax=Rubrivivax sp. A210 TaxID=2772301 RepID=UPI00191A481C|nr:hypothetical protein [Rubrivivax sp. A210]CAD5366588.1 conserved hypothetical protein [Rubrivivax sp. A210]